MKAADLARTLIVSCQPVPDGPMDNADCVVAFALAALAGGAGALRIESLPYVRAVRAATRAPIIGIVKHDRTDTEVRITPTVELAAALCDAGADIVAFDATRRSRPATVPDLVAAIKSRGKLVMADCADVDDAREALAAGADLVGSTLSGYTGGPATDGPDFDLIAAMRELTPHVVAEGRVHCPEQAAEALRCGAFCVVVGSALTRTEHATAWYRAAMDTAIPAIGTSPTLAIDIGGTKVLAGLVVGDQVHAELTIPTDVSYGADKMLSGVAAMVSNWAGRYAKVAVAVSGLVDNGEWSALNPRTLNLPERYPLVRRLQDLFGFPVYAANDAQAAAWGEFRYGAGLREDLVFLTISTGVGGGVVLNGLPRLGLAGHFGLACGASSDHRSPFENEVSGNWIAAQASAVGHDMNAAAVFAAARDTEAWAKRIVVASAQKVARLCSDIQLTLEPKRIIIGGGIGLAPMYIETIQSELEYLPPRLRPRLARAILGVHAGLIGVADLANVSGQVRSTL